jgi:hypothetical protein
MKLLKTPFYYDYKHKHQNPAATRRTASKYILTLQFHASLPLAQPSLLSIILPLFVKLLPPIPSPITRQDSSSVVVVLLL